MKKIIMVLVIFISSIIFYDSYVNLSQKQYNDVINLSYKFAQENDMEVVPIDLLSIPLSEVHAIRYRSPHNPLKKSIFFKS